MIDIIIPVYNNEDKLKRTLSSIALQKIRDLINVYIIDDNSSNNLDDICDIFKDDINITVRKNKACIGIAQSKNKAMEISKGKYIMFIDPGDVFYNPFSVNELYQTIKNNKLDCVYGKYFNIDGDIVAERVLDDENTIAKIYSRKYLTDNKIKFIDDKYYYDYIFNYEVVLGTQNFDIFDSFIVSHQGNNDSFKDDYKKVSNYIKSINTLIVNMEKHNYDKSSIAHIIVNAIVHLYLLYSYNIDNKNLNRIIDKSRSIYNKLIEYNNFYTYNQIYERILSTDYISDLPLLFGEFLILFN